MRVSDIPGGAVNHHHHQAGDAAQVVIQFIFSCISTSVAPS
jgi:hypothetical protein